MNSDVFTAPAPTALTAVPTRAPTLEPADTLEQWLQIIGPTIRAKRKYRDVKLYELAAAAGISKQTLGELERGIAKDVRLSTLWRLAVALNINWADLF